MKFIRKRNRFMNVVTKIIKLHIISFSVLLLYTSVFAQEPLLHENRYPFVRYELNRINIPGDSAPFIRVLEKLRQQKNEAGKTINIVHIGGSHVQADIWTGRVRENINRFFNQTESTRWVIFPYRAVKTNGSLQFDVAFNKHWEGLRNVRLFQPDPMGVMGWKATASDSGQFLDITMKEDSVSRFVFDGLRVFHQSGDDQFQLTIQVDDSVYHPVYADDCQCSEISVPVRSNRFILTVHQTDSLQKEFVLYGIQMLLDQPQVIYHSIGVNGASVSSYLNSLNFEQQLAVLNPDLIIFSIGINDSFGKDFTQQGFEANYSELIRRIRSTCPEPALLFVSNTDSYKKVKRNFYKNPKGKEVQKAMHNLAHQHQGAVWDLFTIMGGYGSIATWKNNGLATRDLIHLTRKGYQLTGDLFFKALTDSLDFVQHP
jgi:lysophospholipase L1-like esterase